MTAAERLAARALWGATLLPGSFDKAFARDMAERAEQADAAPLTERQAATLWALAHRYRRQLFRGGVSLTREQVRDHFERQTEQIRRRNLMDEPIWDSTADVQAMLGYLRTLGPHYGPSDKLLRLFACGVARLCWERLTDPRSRNAVEVAERFALGTATADELARAYIGEASYVVGERADWCAREAAMIAPVYPAVQAGLLRCVVGNPWRPVRHIVTRQRVAQNELLEVWLPGPDPAWLTSTVLALARAACDRDNRLPSGLLDPGWLLVLADAAEEAGLSTEACGRCKGYGKGVFGKGGAGSQTCPDCAGSGRVTHPITRHLRTEREPCGACTGIGNRFRKGELRWGPATIDDTCPACAGAGSLPVQHARGCWAVRWFTEE